MQSDLLFSALVTLAVTIDPPGLIPIFLALTTGMDAAQRREVALRASVIAFLVLTVFAIAGTGILAVFGITLPAFRVAGGILLFFIAFEMIFERRGERKDKTAAIAITKDHIQNISVFPLAIPLIAGPGAISATILLASDFSGFAPRFGLVGIIVGVMAVTLAMLALADRLDRLLGQTGRNILTRLLGVILAALAVQFVADGILALAAGRPAG